MSNTLESLKKVSGISKKSAYGAPLTKKPKGKSDDYLQAFVAGTTAPEEQELSKERVAPVADEDLAKIKIRKEEEIRRRKTGIRSTILTEGSTLG